VETVQACPNLESFYIGTNPLGDTEFAVFVHGVLEHLQQQRMRAPSDDARAQFDLPLRHLFRIQLGALGLTDISLPLVIALVKAIPSLVSVDLSSYKSTKYFGQTHNQFQNVDLLSELGAAIQRNAVLQGRPLCNHFGFQHCFVGTQPQLQMLLLSLTQDYGLNVNAIQYGMPSPQSLLQRILASTANPGMASTDIKQAEGDSKERAPLKADVENPTLIPKGLFITQPGVTHEHMRVIVNPYPAVDYIQSIYRTTMKVGS
jgi:hypothetical protein